MQEIVKADLDEMVFEDREKNYGAYFLRKKYPRHLTTGLMVVAFSAFTFTFGPLIANEMNWIEKSPKKEFHTTIFEFDDLPDPPPIDEKAPPPPPPDLPPPPINKVLASQIPEPAPPEEVDIEDNTIHEMDSLQKAPNIGLEDQEGLDEVALFTSFGDDEGGIPDVIVEKKEPSIKEWIDVDQQPQPVNINDIKDLIGYPQMARDANIQGSVVVRILVDKRGKYQKHKVINQVHPILSKAVEKHISKLTFTPAIQGKNPIPFWVNIPFSFKLLN